MFMFCTYIVLNLKGKFKVLRKITLFFNQLFKSYALIRFGEPIMLCNCQVQASIDSHTHTG